MKKNENITTPGAVVVKQMKLKKMTETELAAQMGVSKNQIQKLIAGEVRLTDATAAKLEKAMADCTVEVKSDDTASTAAEYADALMALL